jgi:hypothetical protein
MFGSNAGFIDDKSSQMN